MAHTNNPTRWTLEDQLEDAEFNLTRVGDTSEIECEAICADTGCTGIAYLEFPVERGDLRRAKERALEELAVELGEFYCDARGY